MNPTKSRKSRRQFMEQATTAVGCCLVCARNVAADTALGSEKPAEALLGYCGLYCGGCQAYQETQSGANADEESRCEGCASSSVAKWCRECEIKTCARSKGIRYCRLCDEYPCDKLDTFTNDPRYPYHKAVHDDMARLEQVGVEQWLAEQEQRWVCSRCGGRYHWFAKNCPTCNLRVNEEYWPD